VIASIRIGSTSRCHGLGDRHQRSPSRAIRGLGRIGLRLEAANGLIRVAATDGAAAFKVNRDALDSVGRSHLGLLLVDDLADRWGLSLDGQ
jgi:hypothetical protein